MHGSEMFINPVYLIAPIRNVSMHLDYCIIIIQEYLKAPIYNISIHMDYRIIIIQEFRIV